MDDRGLVVESSTTVEAAATTFAGFNKAILVIDEVAGKIDITNRYKVYKDINELKKDFESNTLIYKKALAFFYQDEDKRPDELYVVAMKDTEDFGEVVEDFITKEGSGYFVTTTKTNEQTLKDISEVVELLSVKMHFVIQTRNTDVLDPAKTEDIASFMQSKGYRRTTVLFHETLDEYFDMKLVGRVYSLDEGQTWENKVMKGLTRAYKLSSTHINSLKSKNCGFLIKIDGDIWSKNILSANKWFADISRGIDYIDTFINIRVIHLLRDKDVSKDNTLIASVRAIIEDVLAEGVKRKIVNKKTIKIDLPLADELNAGRDIEFKKVYSYDYLHSAHKITINGSVTI